MAALEDMPAHYFGAAVRDILKSPPMRGWHTLPKPVPIHRPIGPEDVRDERHNRLKIRQQAIEGFREGLKALVGQVGIDGSSLRTFMPQQFLNHTQVNTPFQ